MYTYMGTCDDTTVSSMDQSMTFLALGLIHIKCKMAGVYNTCTKSGFGHLELKMTLTLTYFPVDN